MRIQIENVVIRKRENRIYYFGSLKSSIAREVTFVPVLETSPKTRLIELTDGGGYQRPGSQPRMSKFKDFLKTHPYSLVPPVILSGRGKWLFEPSEVTPNLGNLVITDPAAIIDGQHRLGGYVALFESEGVEKDIDFLLLDNLTLQEEKAEFVIVNDTQQGVPKSLSLFNKLDNTFLEGIGQKIDPEYVSIAWALNVREDSPFVGMIARIKLGPEHLFALHSVAQNLEKMFSNGAFAEVSTESKVNIAVRYWQLIRDTHQTQFEDLMKLGVKGQGRKAFEFKLLELTGFIAWSLIGTQILSSSFDGRSQEVDWDKVEGILLALSERIDWRKTGQYQHATGLVGGPVIRRDMEVILARL